jgi:hypothetical protein
MKTSWRSCIAAVVAVAGTLTLAQPQVDSIAAITFSALQPGATLPETIRIIGASKNKPATRYSLVSDDGITVLKAQSHNAVSGLSQAVKVNPADHPILKWRWKVSNTLKTSDLRKKAGDDFPARIYVMFDYPLEKLPVAERTKLRLARALHDPHLPAATLCYVWDTKAPAGTIAPSPYTDRVRIVVAESGGARVNRWLDMERNVAADFRAAFGEDAPAVTAVAIATDTDNTGEMASAFYGDIVFQKQSVR